MVAGQFGSRNYAGDILNDRRQLYSVLPVRPAWQANGFAWSSQ
jgi:hypothetical protein